MDIKSIPYDEFVSGDIGKIFGGKTFHLKQLYDWIHVKLADSYDEMTNISVSAREELKKEYPLISLTPEMEQISKFDGTRKYLFKLEDGNFIESVFMKYHHGNTVCISSQVGCRMGCRFCASTIGGLTRNLRTSEMLDQIYKIQKITGERISNVVVMGTGEPLDNYDNLVNFIRMLSDEHGLNLSQRNITVSTCGIVPNMRKLADEEFSITLALSLHASTQQIREQLLPISKKYYLDDVLDACDYYFEKTGRRITFEYALVAGVNDTEEDARNLIGLIGGKNCHMNLIPVNPIRERSFVRPKRKEAENFRDRLIKGGINATIRRELGSDIDGACGQLRKRREEGKTVE